MDVTKPKISATLLNTSAINGHHFFLTVGPGDTQRAVSANDDPLIRPARPN